MPYKCKHCDAVVKYLCYRTGGYEYGSCSPEGDDWEEEGHECDGDTTFECPECEYEDSNERNIVEEVDDEDEDEEEEIKPIDIMAPIKPPKIKNNPMMNEFRNKRNSMSNVKECPKCKTIIDVDYEETAIECPICNTTVN